MRGLTRLARLINRGLPFRGYTAGWMVAQIALASAVSIVLTGFVLLTLSVTRLGVPYWQLWLLVTVGVLVRWLLLATGEPITSQPGATAEFTAELPLSPYPQAERWEQRLSITEGDPVWFSTVTRDRAAAVVAERVWQRHGIRLGSDPDRARQLLGAPLHSFLTDPLDRTPSPAELRWLVSRMEEI